MKKVFTFWEGKMPDYVGLCLDTWDFEYTMLNYNTLNKYTNLDVDKIQRFSLPLIADIVRVHVLRDQGGYWMDADTIMLTDKLPSENMMGFPDERAAHIGYLNTEPHSDMFEKWAKHQDDVIDSNNHNINWDVMGNLFTDSYIKSHNDIKIGSVRTRTPEIYIEADMPRKRQYERFYFQSNYELADIEHSDMLMLHNSWTPEWYKSLSTKEVLENKCTMSNILKEVLEK